MTEGVREDNKEEKKMINAQGDWLYTCSEIGYALGINPNTIRAGAKRLLGAYVSSVSIDGGAEN